MSANAPDRSAAPDHAVGTLRGRPFRLVRALLLALLRALLGLRLEGLDNVPRTGPVLVVANHLHNADPVLIAVACPRPLHFMAKRELFSIPVIGPLIRGVGSFPVDRGKADRAALRRAEQTLAQGIAVAIFPEGTRSPTASLRRAYPGAALLALRAGVPVLPIAVTGSERLPGSGHRPARRSGAAASPRRGILIRFGQPFVLPRELNGQRTSSEDAANQIMIELARLLPPAYRGDYAETVEKGDQPEPASP